MVEPLSGLVEGEMAEVVWIISEADVREMLGRSGFLYGEVLTCLLKNPQGCLPAAVKRQKRFDRVK